jgi:hypothetical protein
MTIFVFICKTDSSKPVKQEVNGTVILPPLVFSGKSFMGLPPEASGAEAEKVVFWIELADVEVEADDERVPGRPDQVPDQVGYQVVEPVLEETSGFF